MSLTITIPGAVDVTTGSTAPAVLTIGVGVPGAAGPQGPAGPGVPAGGTAGQYLQKIDSTNYNTDWVTLNLSTYAPLASPLFTGDARAVTPAFGDNDTSIATTAFVQSALLGGTAVARNLEVEVRNQSGSTIPAGRIVYISGATGNRPLISLAQANNDTNSAQTIGFVKTAIANNGTGYVIVRGELENIDTSALTEGVQLYLSPTTAGTWTTTKPSAPQHLVYVGVVIRSHPTLGTILVAVQNGYELNELHDVKITSASNGQVLKYDSAQGLWVNGDTAADYITSVTAPLAVSSGNLTVDLSDYLPVSGGALDANSTITASTATVNSLFAGDAFGVELTANPSENASLQYNGVQVQNFVGTMAVTASGLTFPNSSTQTVAYPGASGFLLKADNLAGLANTGTARTNLGLGTMATATAADYSTTTAANLLYYPLSGNPSSFLVAADIAGKANTASPALTGNVSIVSNTSGAALFIEQAGTGNILTLHDQASDTNFVAIDQNGKLNTVPAVTGGAGFNVPHGTAPTTFVDGDIWTTTGGLFARINGSTNQIMDLTTTQTVSGAKTFSNANQTLGNSTAAGTIAIGSGATISGATRVVNIGTASAAGSTNNINIGGGSGTTNVTLGGSINLNGPIAAAINNISLGTGTAASVYAFGTGATTTGFTKAVTIGTGALAGATTTIAIGSTTGTSTTTLQGITNGVTAAADTNSTALATTAYVVGQAGSATPLVNGTAAIGTSLRYARQDHVHGTDTTRAPLASPTFTGTPSLPTGTIAVTQTAGNNTTAVATTAFVTAAVPALATLTDSRQLTNDTKAMSPNDVLWSLMSQDYININRQGFTYTTAGTPQWNDVGSVTTNSRLNSTVASSVIGRPFGPSQVDQVSPFLFRNNWGSNINFNLKTYLSGRAGSFALLTDTAFNQAFYFGKVEGDAIGDLTRRGFGWRWTGGAGSRFVNLIVHNGTTLTVVPSSFAVTSEVAFDWDLYSDGAGNVTLYINGSQVATSNLGPTSYQSAGTYAWWREEVWTTAAPTFGNHTSFFTRGRAAILNY